MKEGWIGAYYPSDLVNDQRLKTVLCLIYDKVVVHFALGGMACGGGHGMTEMFSSDPLVQEGVLDLREEYPLDDIEDDFRRQFPSLEEVELDKIWDFHVTGMALKCCVVEGAVPVTDKVDAPLPLSVLTQVDIRRAAAFQASALAVQSLELILPAFATLSSQDILETRESLRDQLTPFRAAMLALAPKVRSAIDSDAPPAEIYREAKYIAETDILPRLEELKRRLVFERGARWRRLIGKVGSHLPSITLKWFTGGGISAAIDAAKVGGSIAAQAFDDDLSTRKLLSNVGLGYLVSLDAKIESRNRSDTG
ncbi:MAG: hypothetical protein AB1483_04215 [Candidatus Zixiibacteriota bacterium]